MAEAVVSFLLERLSRLVEEEVRLLGANNELKNLEEELRAIMCVMSDAEQQQFSSKEVKNWMEELMDAANDAEDVLDEYQARTESKSLQHVSKRFLHHSCFKQFIFRHKMGSKIKEINKRLDLISKRKDKYKFNENGVGIVSDLPRRLINRQTNSIVMESDIIGRDSDKDTIVERLLGDLDECHRRVVSIVGIGGLGKTALAKIVYNSDRVTAHFKKLMWVCIAEKPTILDLAKKILEEVNDGSSNVGGGSSNLNVICKKMVEGLRGKMFLLVLDDIWDLDWWEGLRAPLLKGGAEGSKILITTRDRQVSERIGAAYAHELRGLSDDHCWALFLQQALREGEEDFEEAVKDEGKKIVHNCGGVPLALKTAGSTMHPKPRSKMAWQAMANSRIWEIKSPEGIIPALLLSYDNLPLHLKPCLVYCRVFPKDYVIKTKNLTRLWMAQGFVKEERRRDMEDTAYEYIEELLRRCLFQDDKRDGDGYLLCFKMHDIVHDLTVYVGGEQYSDGDIRRKRHLPLIQDDESLTDHLGKVKTHLRTLLLYEIDLRFQNENILGKIFSNFRQLRVLNLQGTVITKLPESIGDLIVLRYLNLRNTGIRKLPETITKLCSLQTLDLSVTSIEMLPKGMGQLHSLRHLDLQSTYSLTCLPKGIGRLSCLRTLNRFIVGSSRASRVESGCNITELRNLNKLKGSLIIENIESVRNREEAKEAELEKKENLQDLELRWRHWNEKCEEVEEGVLEELQPPPHLHRIEIFEYMGKRFPKWIVDPKTISCYHSLRKLTLSGCKLAEHLPPLGQLPMLMDLLVFEACEVRSLKDEFHRGQEGENVCVGFPKLEVLKFDTMDSWSEWSTSEKGAMPCLWVLYIQKCPKLEALSPSIGKLQNLYIEECDNLRILPCLQNLTKLDANNLGNWEGWSTLKEGQEEVMPYLLELEIQRCEKLQNLPHLPALNKLLIWDCASLQELKSMQQLAYLHISDLPKLSSLPDGMKKLTKLYIHDCPNLSSLPDGLQNLDDLYVKGCHSLNSLPDGLQHLIELSAKDCTNLSSLSNGLQHLTKLSVEDCPNLSSLPTGLQHITELSVEECPNLSSLPDGLQHLDYLCVKGCASLSSLPNGLQHLTHLKIIDCPNLSSIPDGLSYLIEYTVEGCPNLSSHPIGCTTS